MTATRRTGAGSPRGGGREGQAPRRPAQLDEAQGNSELRPRGSGQNPPLRLAPPLPPPPPKNAGICTSSQKGSFPQESALGTPGLITPVLSTEMPPWTRTPPPILPPRLGHVRCTWPGCSRVTQPFRDAASNNPAAWRGPCPPHCKPPCLGDRKLPLPVRAELFCPRVPRSRGWGPASPQTRPPVPAGGRAAPASAEPGSEPGRGC